MSYGPDTDLLLQIFRSITPNHHLLDIPRLRIHSLPPIPENILGLWCDNTELSELPQLPPRLQILSIMNTNVKRLPTLPETLCGFYIHGTQITELPEIPASVWDIGVSGAPLLIQKREEESIAEFNLRWRAWRVEQARLAEEKASRERQRERCRTVKEELMMEMWKPERVEKWIEAGRWDLLE